MPRGAIMVGSHRSLSSRRQFLGTSVLGAVAWPAWANTQTLPRFSFLVVSDTHLGRGDNQDAARQWERTARELEAAEGDFVLHLGDIVDGGREPQYLDRNAQPPPFGINSLAKNKAPGTGLWQYDSTSTKPRRR